MPLIRLQRVKYVLEYVTRFKPYYSIIKQFIMDQYAFGGLNDAEVTYIFTKLPLKGA